MSKGLYLVARKIASRWEYEQEWEGGDPTQPRAHGLSRPGQSRLGAPDADMDADPMGADMRGRRGGRRNVRGERDSRDGRGGGRRDEGDGMMGGGMGPGGGGRDSYGRGVPYPGNSFDAAAAVAAAAGLGHAVGQAKGAGAGNAQWPDPSLVARVVGAQAAGMGGAGGVGMSSPTDLARFLGQMAPGARESLGLITPAQIAAVAAAASGAAVTPAPQQAAPPQPQVWRVALR